MIATEKVTRKTLTDEDQKRLVEEALAEVDFTALGGDGNGEKVKQLMEEIARVYAEALFDVAKDKDKLDRIHEELNQFAEALADDREMQVFFFSPYFSSAEKRDGDRAGGRAAPTPSSSTSSSC